MGNDLIIKYIVYETINLVNNKIYVGVHHTTTPYEFDKYLGCGVISTLPYTYENAKTAFQYAVKKHGPKNFLRKTLAVFDTLEEAFELERQIVNDDFVAREDTYNMTLGGCSGLYETLKKKVYQYSLTGDYIAEYDSFYDASVAVNKDYTSISYAVKYKSKCNDTFWTTFKIDKLDTSNYNTNYSGKVNFSVYSKSGEFECSFPSLKEGCKVLKISPEIVRDAIVNGLLIKDSFYVCPVKAERFDKARKEYLETRTVYQYDANTNLFLKSFKTQKEAQIQFPKSNIDKSIRLKQEDGDGYRWALVKRDSFIEIGKQHTRKKVYKYDLKYNLICTFNSATEAVKTDGTGVWNVLRQKSKTYKNHIYTYNKVSEIV